MNAPRRRHRHHTLVPDPSRATPAPPLDPVVPTATHRHAAPRPGGGVARQALVLLALLGLLLGLALAGLGGWRAYQGGLLFGALVDLFAGVATVLGCGLVLGGRRAPGVGLCALALLVVLAGALAEIHGNGWMPGWGVALAGRVGLLAGLLLLMLLALAFIPRHRTTNRRRTRTRSRAVLYGAVGLAGLGTLALLPGLQPAARAQTSADAADVRADVAQRAPA